MPCSTTAILNYLPPSLLPRLLCLLRILAFPGRAPRGPLPVPAGQREARPKRPGSPSPPSPTRYCTTHPSGSRGGRGASNATNRDARASNAKARGARAAAARRSVVPKPAAQAGRLTARDLVEVRTSTSRFPNCLNFYPNFLNFCMKV